MDSLSFGMLVGGILGLIPYVIVRRGCTNNEFFGLICITSGMLLLVRSGIFLIWGM